MTEREPITSAGVEVVDTLGGDQLLVIVHGRERIRAVRDAAALRLSAVDDRLVVLERAVAAGDDRVELYPKWGRGRPASRPVRPGDLVADENPGVMAGVLRDVGTSAGDAASDQAAKVLLTCRRAMVPCPHCDGEGEVPA